MRSTFARWLAEIEREANPELWYFSLNGTPDFTYDVAPWTEFVRAAIAARIRRYRERSYTSYVWHDAQASQLRLATSACALDALPFACPVALVDSPEPILAEWLGGVGFIPWSELEPATFDEASEVRPRTLNVWGREHVHVVPDA